MDSKSDASPQHVIGAVCAAHAEEARDADLCPYCLVARLQEDRDSKQGEIHRAHETLGNLRVEVEDLRRQLQQALTERDQARAEVRGQPGMPDPALLLDNYRTMVEQKLAAEAEREEMRAEVEDMREELAELDAVRAQILALEAEANQALAGLAAADRWRPRKHGNGE